MVKYKKLLVKQNNVVVKLKKSGGPIEEVGGVSQIHESGDQVKEGGSQNRTRRRWSKDKPGSIEP